MLDQTDGVIFDRLKLAFVNRSAADRLGRWQKATSNSIVSIRPERYLYASQAKAGRGGAAGLSFADSADASWGIQAINAVQSNFTGKGVKVAILDTGLDLTHPDFIHRTIHQQSFVGTADANDGHGHGTHCIGIACGDRQRVTGSRYGVAHGAEIYVGKVLDDNMRGTELQVLLGIDWAFSNGCKVISLSRGRPVKAGTAHDGPFEGLAQFLLNNNCILIASAGNESN